MKYLKLCIFAGLSIIFLNSFSFAELSDLPLDFYVRHSDLIVEGEVQSKFEKDNLKFARVKIDRVYYGAAKNFVNVISYEGSYKGKPVKEDAPFYTVGEKVILFLRNKVNYGEDVPYSRDVEYYDTVHGMGGIVTTEFIQVRFYTNRPDFVRALEDIIEIKKEGDDNKGILKLTILLDSKDFNTVRAANGYLDYLVNGIDYEKLKIKYSEHESWEEYLKKNVYYSRNLWKKWWHDKNINIPNVR